MFSQWLRKLKKMLKKGVFLLYYSINLSYRGMPLETTDEDYMSTSTHMLPARKAAGLTTRFVSFLFNEP